MKYFGQLSVQLSGQRKHSLLDPNLSQPWANLEPTFCQPWANLESNTFQGMFFNDFKISKIQHQIAEFSGLVFGAPQAIF